MKDDEVLSAALRRAADEVPAGPAPMDEAVSAGRALRRRRAAQRTAVTTAAVAVAAVVAVAGGLPESLRADSSPAARPATTAAPAPRVVDPGEWTGTGRGNQLRLSTDGRLTVTREDNGTAQHQDTAARLRTTSAAPAASLSATAFDDDAGTLWAGIYRGTRTPSRITVAVAGQTVEARLLVLSSRPDWVAYYADVPGAQGADRQPVITARSADGTALATIRKASSPVPGTAGTE
jgi:hypothetical protein